MFIDCIVCELDIAVKTFVKGVFFFCELGNVVIRLFTGYP